MKPPRGRRTVILALIFAALLFGGESRAFVRDSHYHLTFGLALAYLPWIHEKMLAFAAVLFVIYLLTARPPWKRLWPVLLLMGERDTLVPAAAGAAAAPLFQDARVAVITGAGHAPFLQDPQQVAGQLQAFLQQHDARSDEVNA